MNNTWQQIKTAPKDGTWILVTGGRPESYSWYGDTPVPPAVVAMWDKVDEAWGFCDWDGALRSFYDNPTHWMPIPK